MRLPTLLAALALVPGLLLAVPAPEAEATSIAQTRKAAPASEAVARQLYAIWQPYSQGTGKAPLAKIAPLLTPGFHAVLAEAYDPPKGVDGAILEWDPFTASQDSTAQVTVLPAKHAKGHDLVRVRLLGVGQKTPHHLELRVVPQNGKWLIDDVIVREGVKVPSTKAWLQQRLSEAKKK